MNTSTKIASYKHCTQTLNKDFLIQHQLTRHWHVDVCLFVYLSNQNFLPLISCDRFCVKLFSYHF